MSQSPLGGVPSKRKRSAEDHAELYIRYSKRSSDSAQLLSDDGVKFFYPRSALTLFSSFFAGLFDLPIDNNDVDQVIEFRYPAGGVSLVLEAMDASMEGTPIPAHPAEDVRSALLLCATYDFPGVIKSIAVYARGLWVQNPFVDFTLAALREDDTAAWRALQSTLGHHISAFPVWAKEVLTGIDSKYLAYLYKHHDNQGTWLRRLETFIAEDKGSALAPFDAAAGVFPIDCHQKRCPTSLQYGGDFERFRKALASNTMLYWRDQPYHNMREAILLAIDDLPCPDCRTFTQRGMGSAHIKFALRHNECDFAWSSTGAPATYRGVL